MSIPDGYRLFLDVIKGLDEAGRNRLRQDLYAGREHAFIQDPLLGNRLFASDKEDWLSDPRWTKAVEYGNGSCSAGGLYTEWPAHGRILVRVPPTPTWEDLAKACVGKPPGHFREDLPNVMKGYDALMSGTAQDPTKAARQILDGFTDGNETPEAQRLRKSIVWVQKQPPEVIVICKALLRARS